jgi:molybdate transport system ATP-binding protein
MSDAGSVLSVRVALDARDPHGLPIDLSFEAPPGVTVLFGPSGAGKSRTLACIAGIARPHRGRIALGDDVWFDAAHREDLAIHRRRVAFVFQSLALFPHMTAAENVAYGLSPDVPAAERRRLATEMLGKMQVTKLADRRPRTFSGGEAQRVALARALAMRPRVMLLDEPFSALDATVKTELLREVGAIVKTNPIPTLLVTHQAEDAEILGDRVVFVEKGRVVKTKAMSEHPFRR